MKTLFWIAIAVFLLVIVAGGVLWELRPQAITFADGSKLTLLAADYGRRHKPPWLKTSRRFRAERHFTTTNDTLVLWVRQQYDSADWHNFQFYVYDTAGVGCAEYSAINWTRNSRQGDAIAGVQFNAFPRRGSRFYLRAEEYVNGREAMSGQKFVVSNPVRGPFTNWEARSLPETEDDGNFSATLEELDAGAKMPFMRDRNDTNDPINQGIQATFQTQLNETNTDDWDPVAIETSDATGNRATGWIITKQHEGDHVAASYQYGLWPDEAAWKLRVEFSRQTNFSDRELWTVKNVPVQPGRIPEFWNYGRRPPAASAIAETDVGKIHFMIFPAKQFTDVSPAAQPQGGLLIEIDPAPPEGMRLTVAKMTNDHGDAIVAWDYGQNTVKNGMLHRFGLPDLEGTTNLNVTLAFHKSHFVEFTVKPKRDTLSN